MVKPLSSAPQELQSPNTCCALTPPGPLVSSVLKVTLQTWRYHYPDWGLMTGQGLCEGGRGLLISDPQPLLHRRTMDECPIPSSKCQASPNEQPV